MWCEPWCDRLAKVVFHLWGHLCHLDFTFSPWKLPAAWIHFAGWGFMLHSFCINLSQGSPDLQSAVCRTFDPMKVQSGAHFSEQMWSPPPPQSQMGCQKCKEILGDTNVCGNKQPFFYKAGAVKHLSSGCDRAPPPSPWLACWYLELWSCKESIVKLAVCVSPKEILLIKGESGGGKFQEIEMRGWHVLIH